MRVPALDPSSLAAVHRVWAHRTGAGPEVFGTPGTVLVDRPDLTAAVVLRLGRTTVVAAPAAALRDLRAVPPPRLLDPLTLLAALEQHRPTFVGAATLAYADRGTTSAALGGDGHEGRDVDEVHAATPDEVTAVLSTCPQDERDESGVAGMDVRCVARTADGDLAAVAGYEVWQDAVGHIGLAVVPRHRGQGWGRVVARGALRHALDAGLVAQWRCRVGHSASARVRDRLGFIDVGRQVAVDLADAPTPDRRAR